jgi:hypothetical protein
MRTKKKKKKKKTKKKKDSKTRLAQTKSTQADRHSSVQRDTRNQFAGCLLFLRLVLVRVVVGVALVQHGRAVLVGCLAPGALATGSV